MHGHHQDEVVAPGANPPTGLGRRDEDTGRGLVEREQGLVERGEAPSDTSEEDEKKEKEKRDWKVRDTDFKFHRLWALALEKDAEGKRTPRQLTLQHLHVGGEFDWSPDDWKIAFDHTPTPRINDWPKTGVSEVEVAGGIVRPLTNSEAAEFSPLYSPDGRWIAYIASDIPPTWAIDGQVHVIPAAGGTPRALATTYDR